MREIKNREEHPQAARRREPASATPGAEAGAAAFSRRIAQLIESAGSASAFARSCGVSESVVRKWRAGLSDPSRAYLERIARCTGVSMAWLVAGDGPMRPEAGEEPRHRAAAPPATGYAALPPARETPPVAGASPASAQAEALVFSEDWLRDEFGARAQDLCLIRVTGDSMEPTLRAGDMVLVDRRATQPDREGMYVLRMQDMLLVKRLQALPGGLVKVSGDNSALDSFQVKLSDIGGRALSVVGRVAWFGRRL